MEDVRGVMVSLVKTNGSRRWPEEQYGVRKQVAKAQIQYIMYGFVSDSVSIG